MHSIIQEVISLLGHTLDKNIKLVHTLGAANPHVNGDPNQLHQVILNLAVNARDAMGTGGDLTFQTSNFVVDEYFCHSRPECKIGTYMLVTVRDTGEGIPGDILPRIFEPFFTTKDIGKGSGMGLAMVYGIVKNHGGLIEVNSEPGRGTLFKVYLPLVQDKLDEGIRGKKELVASSGKGHVLLIDDEAVVLDTAAALLKEIGYRVTAFYDVGKAVTYYGGHFSEFDLVIIDMIMPVIDGRECFNILKEINPGIKAVLSTGYGLNGKAQEILNSGMAGFIQKPYSIEHLAQVLREILNK